MREVKVKLNCGGVNGMYEKKMKEGMDGRDLFFFPLKEAETRENQPTRFHTRFFYFRLKTRRSAKGLLGFCHGKTTFT